MTENKRFTNIEHDYENAWIKCNDDGDFMIYAIYKELDESLPSLEDLLNGLHEENKELKKENEQLKQINRNLGDFREFITEQNVVNEKQRKELQLQMLRLYNYFENWFEDTMSPNAFSEMWDDVKEDEKWDKR